MSMSKQVAHVESAPADGTRQTDLRTTRVVQHLLWHKALVEHDDDGGRISQYVRMVDDRPDGEHVAIRDPFHRDLAIAFELVLSEHMDPWDLDLRKFAELYLKEAQERGVDIVTAGRIILMAWTVLKLQSDEVAEHAQSLQQPEEEFEWDMLPDWQWSDDEWDYTERIRQLPRAPIDEKIRHKGDRKVTLMELIGALEEAHDEAESRRSLRAQQAQARARLKRRMRGRVGNMMHTEDLDAEIRETWQRILDQTEQPIPFRALHEPDAMDLVQTFNAMLFLAKDRKVNLSQEEFPYGDLWITPLEGT